MVPSRVCSCRVLQCFGSCARVCNQQSCKLQDSGAV
jgi:hypothetical protein